ncbi:Zinc finger and SCAN domain-containing protein 29 [Chelonia mydas]|uniref:Zinc finger and SCAN domain-containing protein 29 n=1 Tax=Chelonia mydas TaxID=8469 RepID=M7AUD9_CHEMY|nr:Zinc finger and SCAN domain-containing protein 29 [Chelonia mydas]
MQSSSAEVTMMESQNRKRAPAWTEREVRDLIAVWGEESVLSELRSSFRNAKTFVKISQGIKSRGHNRALKQCHVKLKELRQANQKTREANSRSGSEPKTGHFYDELHAILGGSATTTLAVLFDSFSGDGGNTESGFGDEEDDDEVVDSSQQASGETGFPDSQELFLTLDLEPVPPEPTQGCLLDPPGGEGTSGTWKDGGLSGDFENRDPLLLGNSCKDKDQTTTGGPCIRLPMALSSYWGTVQQDQLLNSTKHIGPESQLVSTVRRLSIIKGLMYQNRIPELVLRGEESPPLTGQKLLAFPNNPANSTS